MTNKTMTIATRLFIANPIIMILLIGLLVGCQLQSPGEQEEEDTAVFQHNFETSFNIIGGKLMSEAYARHHSG